MVSSGTWCHPASPRGVSQLIATVSGKALLTHSILAPSNPFAKSTTSWDGRPSQPGFDITYDGVVHVGMLPDFIEELEAMGVSSDELQPLWHGAEAYIRSWSIAEGFENEFDTERPAEKRAQCEQQRKDFLQGLDEPNYTMTRGSLELLRTLQCRGRHGLP